jgi:ankyrin repeat protein
VSKVIVLVGVCVVVAFGVHWCQENVGYVDLMTGRRGCGAPPSEIRAWALESHTRRAEEAGILQQWAAAHPGRVNKQYGAFCNTPLHLAARFGREDLADPLIGAGADVEARNGLDERPLHVSAAYGRPTVARLLLARGADVHARGRGGKTPLHVAAVGLGGQSNAPARIEVARLLLAAGADVNARESGSGFTPLRYATSFESRNAGMADLLLAHGADPRGAEERRSAPPGRTR